MDISTLINTLGQKIENQDLTNLVVKDRKISFNIIIGDQELEVDIHQHGYGGFEYVRLFNRNKYNSETSYCWDLANITLDHKTCSAKQFHALSQVYDLAKGKTMEWKIRDVFASWTNVKV